MSYVMALPQLMTAAATDVATIGSNLSAAHLVAAAPTVALIPAAADEVSAGIANLLSGYGQEYQALAGQAAAFQEQFVQVLKASADAYAFIERAIASYLQWTIANEEYVVSRVVADPTLLLNPDTYGVALASIHG